MNYEATAEGIAAHEAFNEQQRRWEAEERAVLAKLRPIVTVALDCDGVLTDGAVWVDDNGHETARFSRRDGHGIAMLREAGIRVLVITREASRIATARCAKMRIECHQGVMDKAAALRDLVPDLATCLYVGDDLPDLPCLEIVGVPCCPADAVEAVSVVVRDRAGIVITRCGGDHCVRELADMIIAARAAK